MSVQCNHYVIYGYSLKWVNTDHLESRNNDQESTLSKVFNKYRDSAFDPAKSNSFMILDDGMNGEHCIIGVCLASTENYEGFHRVVDCTANAKDKKLLKKSIEQLKLELPEYYEFESRMDGLKPKVFVVSHYR